jgi:6-pyruvoyltetrahydropterin/6-carboxytetrahydropterin synthase
MFTICKQFHFSASHIIEGLPESHPCARLHGHNYIVEIVLQSKTIDSIGFIVDYGELKPFKEFIVNQLDHRHLNDVIVGSTSAESIAYYLYQKAKTMWPEVVAIRISETPKTWAEYRE